MSQQTVKVEPQTAGDESNENILRALRRVLLAVLLVGILGTGTELVLLDHFEDRLQLIPLVLLGLGLVVITWHVIHQGRASVRVLRTIMVLFVMGGLLGLVLHYRGSMEFQLEVNPDLSGLELFLKAIRAKAPPALGPGAMIHLGLVGLAYAYRYPVSSTKSGAKTTSTGE
ncbi:MAG: hypothetical protein AABO41_23175 [Acidobacteriota bacterium]